MQERITTLRTEVQTLTNQAKTMYADLETKGDKATADERTNLNNLIDQGHAKRQELERLEKLAANDEYVNQPARGAKAREQGRDVAAAIAARGRKTWGQRVLDSEQYKAARKGSTAENPRMDRVNVKGEI